MNYFDLLIVLVLLITFYSGYKELNDEDFFQIADEDLETLNLADKTNLYFKNTTQSISHSLFLTQSHPISLNLTQSHIVPISNL